MYLPDSGSGSVWRIGLDGQQVRVAGNLQTDSCGVGDALTTAMKYPEDIAFDVAGNMYVADSSCRQIFKVTPGGEKSVFAGNGQNLAPVEGPATGSPMGGVMGLDFDSDGNLYATVPAGHRVVKITPSGDLSFWAGNGSTGVPVDGPALSSPVQQPQRIRFDSAGNAYITQGSFRYAVKVTRSGTLSHFAGTGAAAIAVPGLAVNSPLNFPIGVDIDGEDNVYIGTAAGNEIVKINPAGTLSLVIGTGTKALPTYGQIALGQNYTGAYGVAVTESGVVYVSSDDDGALVDRIGPTTPSAPRKVTALGGNAEAVVSWLEPTSWGITTSLVGYTVQAYIDGVAVPGKTCTTTTLTCTITGLTNGQTYTFKVLAANTQGNGSEGTSNAIKPEGSEATKPNKPRKLRISGTAVSKKRIASWLAPSSGGEVSLYRFTVRQAGYKRLIIDRNVVAPKTKTTFTKAALLRKTVRSKGDIRAKVYRYVATVRAENAAGSSTVSRVVFTVRV